MFQISEVLRKVPFFQTLGKDGIDFIVERLKFKPFEANALICKAGDPGDKMYIIINGEVKVVVTSEGGEENLIAKLTTGDYFGEMALLTGEPRSASVITTEGAEMFILNQSDFDVIIERFPSITLSMGKIMSQRLRETLKKAAAKPSSGGITTVRGNLQERKLVDVLKFCDNNSLNGKVVVKSGSEVGEFHYEKGELKMVKLGDLPEDRALDTMLNWPEGDFVIEPRPMQMDGLQEKAAAKPKEKFVIIIVNNSMIVQKLLQRAFDSMGYEVYAVETAAKAKNMVKSMNPHLVIADTKLPDAAGSAFISDLRQSSALPVVMLTETANRSQYEAETSQYQNIYFTNSHEVGEVVKVVEGVLS